MKSISIFLLGLVLRLTETCAQTMPQAPTMDQFIGINIIADRADYQKAGLFRTVRIFQDWPNDAGIANSADLRRPLQPQSFAGYVSKKISCSLSYNRSRAMDFVEIYKRFRAAPALNQLAPEFFGIQDPGAFSSLAWYRPVCQNQVGNTASSPYYFGGLSSLSGETFAKLPVKRFGNALDYRNYAKWATLFAAQFGSKTFSGSHPLFQNLINWHVPNFRIAPPRVNIQYMEIWNEAEKFWKDQHLLYHGRLDLDGATNDAYQGQIIGSHQTSTIDNLERTMSCFRPDEYGAMLSAAYDGHGGAPDPLQQTGFEIPGVFIEGKQAYLGIKNVDPGIKVVFTGLVDFRHNYVKKTIDALYSTGGRKPSAPVPFDVLNFHHYSSTGGLRNNQHFNEFINGYNFFGASGATIGVHPELSDENLKDRVKNLIESLESTAGAAAKPFDLNSKEIWVSEFGYDSYLEPTPTHGATGVELPLNIRTSVEPAFSIVNASFESGTTSWVSDFANRGTTSNPQNVNAAWKSVPAYAGTNMAWIEAPPSTLPRIAWSHPQPYVVQPYTRYKISMWVQNVFNQPAPDADPAKNATPGFYWTANGQRISPTTSYIAYKDNNDWVQVSGYWFSGPSTNATFALMLAPKSVTNIPNSAFVMDAARSGFFDNIAETQGQWLMRSLLELSAGRSMNGRHLDKAFLYKLNDDPGQANSQFGYCGLLDANNTPKESWYYVRTLQNVLTGSAFASDNTTLGVFTPNPGQPNISSTDLHCYLYENGLDKTLVVWSGTASGKKSIGKLKITFPGGSNYNFQFATIISVLVPDENGKREFRGNLSDNTIVNLQVSETPVFVKLQKDESDPPVQPVTGLTASASCCNGVRLSWDIPSNQTYQYYRVYYTPASSSGALPPFDISTWTLYAEQLPGTRREIVITGLEANTTYAFAVLPVAGGAGNEVLPDLANVVPYIYTTVDCSAANCLLSNSAFGVGTDPTVAGAVQNMLSSTGACNQLNDNPNCAFGWQGTATPGIDPSDIVTITFTKPQRINAIYLFTTGQGRLEFEFMGCDNCWAPLTRMEVYQTNNGQWTVLDASEIPPVPIKKIRVTRTGLIGATGVPGDGTGFAVCKMLFCAEESACPPPGGLEGAEQVKNLNALYVERDAALINWQTALAEASRPEWGIARLYEVSYSRTLGEDGQLIEPRVEIVEVSLNDALAWLRIFGLEPASTYHIQVKPLIRVGEPECETVLPGEARALITITTPDANGANGRSVESLKNEVLNAVRVYPNPATDWLRVESPKMGLRELEIWDAAGRMIIRKRTLNQPSAMSVNVVELPAGVYFLKIMGATGEVSIKPFVKIEE